MGATQWSESAADGLENDENNLSFDEFYNVILSFDVFYRNRWIAERKRRSIVDDY